MRKREGDAITEYAVDPAQVAVALAAKVTFDTGLLSGDTLLVRTEGVRKTVVEYRKAQKTGVYLDGSETALRVPLPGLLMIRTTNEDRNPILRGLCRQAPSWIAGSGAVPCAAAECLQQRQHLLGIGAAGVRRGAVGRIAGRRLVDAAGVALWRPRL